MGGTNIGGTSPLDKALLADLLRPYIQLRRSGDKWVEFTPEWKQLTNEKKIIMYLLGRKAFHEALKDDPDAEEFDEKAAPSVISDETRIQGGTSRPVLKLLRDKGYAQDDNGYYIPNNALPHIQQDMESSSS